MPPANAATDPGGRISMPALFSTPWMREAASRRGASPVHAASSASPSMRVSDAERGDVADRLSKHYGDGRLDQAEFNERLDQAMRAKTRQDLDGLFTDLPEGEAVANAGAGQAPHGHPQHGHPQHGHPQYGQRRHRVLFLVLVIALTAVGGQALVRSYIPWFLIGLLVALWLRYGPWPDHRRDHSRDHSRDYRRR
jgi:Domain of unknown function (DUF1707)